MLGGVYVMVAVAFTLIIGMLNFLNFTVPALFMLASVLMWAILEGHGIALDLTAIAVLLVLAMMAADRVQHAELPGAGQIRRCAGPDRRRPADLLADRRVETGR